MTKIRKKGKRFGFNRIEKLYQGHPYVPPERVVHTDIDFTH
jgi:hypothetical protein